MEEKIKDKISKLLKEFPEGLTLNAIADKLEETRYNVTQSVLELASAGLVEMIDFDTMKIVRLK